MHIQEKEPWHINTDQDTIFSSRDLQTSKDESKEDDEGDDVNLNDIPEPKCMNEIRE